MNCFYNYFLLVSIYFEVNLEKGKLRDFIYSHVVSKTISAILLHFQSILSQFSLTYGIFLRVLSYPFFKFKIKLSYPKILIVVNLIIT